MFPYSLLLGSTMDTCLASVSRGLVQNCKNCGFSAVAVHRWSSTSFSFRRGSSSWSRLCSRPQRFPSCCSMVDVPVMRACRVSCAAVEKTLALPQLQLGLFLRPFVFGRHLFGARLVEYRILDFSGFDLRKRSRIQRLLVQHWIHVYVSYGGFWYFSHIFYVKEDLGSRFCAMLGSTVDTCFATVSRLFGRCPCRARRAGSHGYRRGGDSRAPTVAFVEKFLVEWRSSSTR